jgi:hypothetical protein
MYFPKTEMDFNMKKFVRDAGTALSRVVQVCYCIESYRTSTGQSEERFR